MVRRQVVLALAGACALICSALGFATTAGATARSTTAQDVCIAHHPQEFVWYTHSCTGHDEPEIDPLSNHPGSAQDLTWTIVLPTNGAVQVDNVDAMLTDSADGGALVMHAGDTITDHQYVTAARDGMHITVTDLTTGHSGTIVLNAKGGDGPLLPAFDTQTLGNALSWGLVNDAPNSLVWEIGHTGNYTTPAGQFCLPGSATKPPCPSYDVPTWLQFQPLQIKGV